MCEGNGSSSKRNFSNSASQCLVSCVSLCHIICLACSLFTCARRTDPLPKEHFHILPLISGFSCLTLSCLQPFYMCEENGRSTAFLCPNGTIFNQQYFVCDWWILNDCLQPSGQPKNYQVVQHWLRSSTGLLQLEPVPLRRARRGWVHFLSFHNHPHLPLKVNDATLSSVSMISRTRKVLLCVYVCVCVCV